MNMSQATTTHELRPHAPGKKAVRGGSTSKWPGLAPGHFSTPPVLVLVLASVGRGFHERKRRFGFVSLAWCWWFGIFPGLVHPPPCARWPGTLGS